MRREDIEPATPTSSFDGVDEFFETTLTSGKTIVMREMSAADLLYLEKTLGNVGDMERSMRLAARLSTEKGKITFDELQKLKMKDLKRVTELLAKAGGTDDEDADPNF